MDIVLIILDTLRRDRLSAYGHERETSPHFDSFAAESTLFERAVSPAQWTIPAHASLFTGYYPTTHQLIEANRTLSASYPTLAEILRDNGYHTAGFCNNPLVGVLDNGLQRGFLDFYNYAGAAPNRPLAVQRSGVRRVLSRGWQRFARSMSQHFAQSYWLFRLSLNPRLTPIWTRSINYKGNTENSISDMIAYMQQPRDKPLFTFLNLMGAHLPYRPPADYLPPSIRHSKAAGRVMTRFNADAARWASPDDPPLSADERQIIDGFYTAEIAHQDHHLGRLLDYLRGRKNTLVVIAADHGEGHGDHQFFGHSFVVYQELVHVPLLIHHPDRYPAGKRVTTNISTRRLFHTLLDAAGVTPPLPEGDPNANIARMTDVHALSLARSLNGKPDSEGDMAFAEAFPPQTFLSVIQQRNPQWIDRLKLTQVRRGAYHGDHKLAVVGAEVEGLFNLQDDPGEVNDVSTNAAEAVMALQSKLRTFVDTAASHRVNGGGLGEMSDAMREHLRALGYIE